MSYSFFNIGKDKISFVYIKTRIDNVLLESQRDKRNFVFVLCVSLFFYSNYIHKWQMQVLIFSLNIGRALHNSLGKV